MWLTVLLISPVYAIQQDIDNSSVISYWRLDETEGNITDYKGVANSTSVNGTVIYGITGFDGVGKGINITAGSFFDFGGPLNSFGSTQAMHVYSGINLSNWTYIVRFYTGFNSASQRKFLTGKDQAFADFFNIGEDGNFLTTSLKTNTISHLIGGEDINPTNNIWHLFVMVSNSITGINMSLDAVEFKFDPNPNAKHVVNITKPMDLRLNIMTNPTTSDETLYDDIAILNISLNSSQILDLNSTELIELIVGHTTAAAATQFTITATDQFDSVSLTNITVQVLNSSFTFNTSTENGTIILTNTNFKFSKLYDIRFSVNDSGGYFNNTFVNINITELSSFEGTLFQSVQQVLATDILNGQQINSFTADINDSSASTTTGKVSFFVRAGDYQINITASGFEKLVSNFSINPLENNSINLSIGSAFTFNLIRESTNTVFDFNSTNSTVLNVFCPDQSIVITFNTSSNSTQVINCQFTLMQMVVDYEDLGSYFRTLIPPFSQKNITWYLIDLAAGDTAIQRVINLLDLTGEFANSILTVERAIGGVIKTIIDQRFDISNNVNLFLLKDEQYTISIDNGLQDIVLGNLIPTEAGTQTITLPKINFVPQETILGGNVSWTYTFNVSILRVQYEDVTNRTTLVRFTVFNDTGAGGLNQLFQGESNNNASVIITFNQALFNNTYATELFVIHQDLGNFTDKKIFYEFKGSGGIDLEGWTPIEQEAIKKWIAWLFLGIWGLLFSRRYMGVGMSTMIIFLWIFKTWNWIEVSNLIFGFVTLLAVVGWIVDAMRKN